jgi:uncharacterized cupredoxin-like copper-binding protein
MTKIRVATLGLAVVAVLAWAWPAAGKTSAPSATTVTVTAGKPSEFGFKLSKLTVPKGAVTFKVTNSGAIVHDFKIGTKKTKNLSPGQSQTITVTFAKPGKYAFLCTVTGHAAAGMKGMLTVK